MIIDTTYFSKGELVLPIDNFNTDELTYYINEHEPIILKKLLGYQLYKEFSTALAGTPAQKWIDLRDGEDYTYNSILKQYQGIKQIIADYVYCQIVGDKQTEATTSGVKKSLKESAEAASPRYKQVFAYNDMVTRSTILNEFILASNDADSSNYENYLPTVQNKVNVFNI